MEAGADHGLSRARMTRQLESSLDRLGVDYIDVYLAHAPDEDTPLEELVGTFEGLRNIGLIKAWGVSNFSAAQLRELCERGRPAVVENNCNLLEREDEHEVIPLCGELNISYLAFGPLAGGLLTGRYQRGTAAPSGSRLATRPEGYEHLLTDKTFDGLERFKAAAEERGVTPAMLALAWLLARPGVASVIVGARTQEHLGVALRSLDVAVSPAEADMLTQLF
jgi:aryl-alcohol dehydrogenase-like predicted oxidoreductase